MLLAILLGTLPPAEILLADGAVVLGAPPGERYRALTRWNLRRYENGRYLGLTYREVEATLDAGQGGHGWAVVFEQTLRDLREVARAVRSSEPGRLPQSEDVLSPPGRGILPVRSGLPAYPEEAVSPGARWSAPGIAYADPLWSGAGVLVPFEAAYRYDGVEQYQGRAVHRVSAEYGLRWPPLLEEEIELPSSDILQLRGNYGVTILLEAETMHQVLLRETIREEYHLADGTAVSFDGFSLTWVRAIAPGADRRVAQSLEQSLVERPIPELEVEVTDRGTRIRLANLRFAADTAQLLPAESGRLAEVAAALLRLDPEARFLVVGHTAEAGTAEGRMLLSIQRAEAVLQALVSRGIAAGRLLYEGKGAAEPIAGNDTEAGMGLNRRVEIYVLEGSRERTP